jgi:hypothetical protein
MYTVDPLRLLSSEKHAHPRTRPNLFIGPMGCQKSVKPVISAYRCSENGLFHVEVGHYTFCF